MKAIFKKAGLSALFLLFLLALFLLVFWTYRLWYRCTHPTFPIDIDEVLSSVDYILDIYQILLCLVLGILVFIYIRDQHPGKRSLLRIFLALTAFMFALCSYFIFFG